MPAPNCPAVTVIVLIPFVNAPVLAEKLVLWVSDEPTPFTVMVGRPVETFTVSFVDLPAQFVRVIVHVPASAKSYGPTLAGDEQLKVVVEEKPEQVTMIDAMPDGAVAVETRPFTVDEEYTPPVGFKFVPLGFAVSINKFCVWTLPAKSTTVAV